MGTSEILADNKNGKPAESGIDIRPFIKDFAKLTKEYGKSPNAEDAPPIVRFCLKPNDLEKLLSVPAFAEISIYPGIKNNKLVLFLVPAIKVLQQEGKDDPEEVLLNVHTQNVTVDGEQRTASTMVTLSTGPCPPYPRNCNNCNCT